MKRLFLSTIIALLGMNKMNSQSFEYKESGTDFILMDLSIPLNNPNIAYAGGSQFTTEHSPGIVIKSEDAGETWTTIYEGDNVQALAFATTLKGFIGGYAPTVKKTEDGGATWEDINIGSEIYGVKIIQFFDENQGIILYMNADYDMEVRTTQDGGETW